MLHGAPCKFPGFSQGPPHSPRFNEIHPTIGTTFCLFRCPDGNAVKSSFDTGMNITGLCRQPVPG